MPLIAHNSSVWSVLFFIMRMIFLTCPLMALTDPLSLFPCCCRSQHPWCPGGRPPRPPTHALRQHAAGRGCGGTRERWRICSCCSCCRGLRRGRRQLHWTFWLQSQTHPDQTDLPHRAGEVWAGEEECGCLPAALTLPIILSFYWSIFSVNTEMHL